MDFDFLSNPNFLSTVMQTGAGLLQNYNKSKEQQEEEDKALKLMEMKLMFQKPSGGGGRSGGGSLRNRNADLIESMSEQGTKVNNALTNWADLYIKAVR